MANPDVKDKKWEQVQIKAFKSWVNGILEKKNLPPVENLTQDFQDGVKLIIFLEGVTGKSVGKYDRKPAQKIQKIQNLSIALHFIQQNLEVKMVGVGPEDIHDGNLKLILGMLWSLFRKLRIAAISEDGKSSEDGLLLWVKKMTAGYPGVNITNFKESFNDGLAFSALINKFNPDILNYNAIDPSKKEDNIETSFDLAERHLGIPKLLEAADLLTGSPDERSVILYVSLFFHAFVSNEERKKLEASKSEITDKMSLLESSLAEAESERQELRRRTKELEEQNRHLQQQIDDKEKQFQESEEKLKLLEAELDYLTKRLEKDAETIALLEEKIHILSQLLDAEGEEKGAIEASRARLKAELEELRNRGKQLANEKESLEELRTRLLTENEKKDALLKELDARKNALQNELSDLRNKVANEVEKRKAAAKQILDLRRELEAVKKRQIVQGKARGGLDILRINLEEHLEDMYRWRELHELDLEDEKRVFDIEKVMSDIKDKTFDEQLEYLNENLQAENASLLRIIRLKDSKFKLKDIEVKSGWLSMKGRKDWKKRWFSLRGQALYYYESESADRCEGFVDLTKGCEVVRQKAVKEDDSVKKQWPLKITVGDRKLFVRATSKKERHSWYLFLASKIAHINYLKACEGTGNRPDTRLVTLFATESVPNVFLEHRPIPEEAALALSKTLPAHDETETLSLHNSSIGNAAVKHIGEVLEKLNAKTLNLSNNKIGDEGAADLARGIAQNLTLTEVNLENNEVSDAGAAALAATLQQKPAIIALNLSGNRISQGGVRALADVLASDRNFSELSLARNAIDDSSAADIARLIKGNNTLTTVRLDGNKLTDAGVATIADALAASKSVLYVDLSKNQIGNAGAAAIQKVLKSNTNIISVNLSNNTGISAAANLVLDGFNYPNLSISRAEPQSF